MPRREREIEIRVIENHDQYRREFTNLAPKNYQPTPAIIIKGKGNQPHRILIDGEVIPSEMRSPVIEHEKVHALIWEAEEKSGPKVSRLSIERAANLAAERKAESLGNGGQFREFIESVQTDPDPRYIKWMAEWILNRNI